MERLRSFLGLEELHKLTLDTLRDALKNSPWNLERKISDMRTEKQIERAVDNHMMVNNSLVDNEFNGAELPCRLDFSFRRNVAPTSRFFVSQFLVSKMPEECAVRWIVSFLARFGSQWLIRTTKLVNFSKRDESDEEWGEESPNADLQNRLAAFVALSVTQTVEMEDMDGEASAQQVSVVSPLHVMCSDLFEPWTPILKVTGKHSLPYSMRRGSSGGELNFEGYAASIRNVLFTRQKALNELDETNSSADFSLSPLQVACFSKLMEEENFHYASCFSRKAAPVFALSSSEDSAIQYLSWATWV